MKSYVQKILSMYHMHATKKYQKGIYNVIRFHIELHRYLEHMKYKSIFDGFNIN